MSESPPPFVSANTFGHAQEVLTPEAIEAVLGDFRAWLQQLAAAAPADRPAADETAPIDLHTLLGQFVALRHEVNLQTKTARAQQEQNAETLRQLSQAVEAFRQTQTQAQQADQQTQEEHLRPLLKALVDLEDALALAGKQVQRVQEAIEPVLSQLAAAIQPLPELALGPQAPRGPEPPPSLLARWFGPPAKVREPSTGWQQVWAEHRQQQLHAQQQAQQAAERVRQVLDSVVTGYTMSVQRVQRALQQQGLEPIAVLGQPFDPEQMEVIEVVSTSDLPANQVVDEVRRGYLWRGRVFRYAQVRVAKP